MAHETQPRSRGRPSEFLLLRFSLLILFSKYQIQDRPIFFIDVSELAEGNATNTEYAFVEKISSFMYWSINFRMPEITESFTLLHNEQQLTINGDNLEELRLLGRGNFSPNVMLCQVKNHPELKMAVKVSSISDRILYKINFSTGILRRCIFNFYFSGWALIQKLTIPIVLRRTLI